MAIPTLRVSVTGNASPAPRPKVRWVRHAGDTRRPSWVGAACAVSLDACTWASPHATLLPARRIVSLCTDPDAGLRADLPAGRDPGEAAFDRVDELCADGPVVLCADDAHYLDAASLTLLRRLAWASQGLPLALLINTRPSPCREQLTMLVRQAQIRLWLLPMSRMMVERLVFDRTGRWPGPQLRRILGLAAGNPLFAGELLRAYKNAGALAEAGPDAIEARKNSSACRRSRRCSPRPRRRPGCLWLWSGAG